MSDYLVTDTELTSIADAIRTKGGTSADLSFPTGFVSAIEAISGGGLEYEEGTWTPTEDIKSNATASLPELSFTDTHTSPPAIAIILDTTDSALNTEYAITYLTYIDTGSLLGNLLYHYSSSSWNPVKEMVVFGFWRGNFLYNASTTIALKLGWDVTQPDPPTHNAYPSYWVTKDRFRPATQSSTYKYIAGRTYKWIAIWT